MVGALFSCGIAAQSQNHVEKEEEIVIMITNVLVTLFAEITIAEGISVIIGVQMRIVVLVRNVRVNQMKSKIDLSRKFYRGYEYSSKDVQTLLRILQKRFASI